jgi:hypothetical protein
MEWLPTGIVLYAGAVSSTLRMTSEAVGRMWRVGVLAGEADAVRKFTRLHKIAFAGE